MTKSKPGPKPKYPDEQRVVQALLAQGLATPAELTGFAGVARQLVQQWGSKIRWREIRRARLRDEWRKELKRGTELAKG